MGLVDHAPGILQQVGVGAVQDARAASLEAGCVPIFSAAFVGVTAFLYSGFTVPSGFLARAIGAAPDPFALKQVEEALGDGIVMAVAPSTHAPPKAMVLQEVLPVVTGVLATLI